MANNALTNLNNANIIAYMQFENLVDIFMKDPSNPKFFGNWIYPLIMTGHISMELLRRIRNLMEERVLPMLPNCLELQNDYHSHMSYVYLLKEDYVQAINELVMIQDNHTLKERIFAKKSFESLIRTICKNYDFDFNSLPLENEDYIYALVRLQDVVKYWNCIRNSKIAKNECLNALMFFQSILRSQNRNPVDFEDVNDFKSIIKVMFEKEVVKK